MRFYRLRGGVPPDQIAHLVAEEADADDQECIHFSARFPQIPVNVREQKRSTSPRGAKDLKLSFGPINSASFLSYYVPRKTP